MCKVWPHGRAGTVLRLAQGGVGEQGDAALEGLGLGLRPRAELDVSFEAGGAAVYFTGHLDGTEAISDPDRASCLDPRGLLRPLLASLTLALGGVVSLSQSVAVLV